MPGPGGRGGPGGAGGGFGGGRGGPGGHGGPGGGHPPMGGGHHPPMGGGFGHRPPRRHGGGCCGCLMPVIAIASVAVVGIVMLLF